MQRLTFARRASQIFFCLLFFYILWSTTYPLSGPVPARAFFMFDPLIVFMLSLSARVLMPGIVFACAMLLLSAVIGRFFCGWVCPLGTMIDLAGRVRKKYPRISDAANRLMRRVKFVGLGVVTVAALFGVQLAWIGDPLVIMARFVSLNLIPAATFLLDGFFVILIRDLHAGQAVMDFYRAIKPTVLGVQTDFFSNSAAILLFFCAILALSLPVRRLWCRALCPLGALYALASRRALLRRSFKGCTACGLCKSGCRMGAIRDDLGYEQGECILCMDCVYDCPQNVTRFGWRGQASWWRGQASRVDDRLPRPDPIPSKQGLSRRQFLFFLSTLPFLSGFRFRSRQHGTGEGVIRPPAALPEAEFLDRCIRCGNCMKVCITNGLQPVLLESGMEGIWTPQLVPEIGYCEYQCTLCGQTCPTQAIRPLSLAEKKVTRLGVARIDPEICIPWAEGKQCIVCEEHCPVADKAIKLTFELVGGVMVSKPYVDTKLCVGCGICQNKCPVRPTRAIRVLPLHGTQ